MRPEFREGAKAFRTRTRGQLVKIPNPYREGTIAAEAFESGWIMEEAVVRTGSIVR